MVCGSPFHFNKCPAATVQQDLARLLSIWYDQLIVNPKLKIICDWATEIVDFVISWFYVSHHPKTKSIPVLEYFRPPVLINDKRLIHN